MLNCWFYLTHYLMDDCFCIWAKLNGVWGDWVSTCPCEDDAVLVMLHELECFAGNRSLWVVPVSVDDSSDGS